MKNNIFLFFIVISFSGLAQAFKNCENKKPKCRVVTSTEKPGSKEFITFENRVWEFVAFVLDNKENMFNNQKHEMFDKAFNEMVSLLSQDNKSINQLQQKMVALRNLLVFHKK